MGNDELDPQADLEKTDAEQADKQIPPAEVKYAEFWLRFLSAILDCCVFIIVLQIAAFLIEPQQIDEQRGFFHDVYSPVSDVFARQGLRGLLFDPLKSLIFGIFWLLFSMIYNTLFEYSGLNATPGKVVMGICVMDPGDQQPSFLQAFLRNVFKVFSALPLMAGFILVIVTKKNQALHDLLSNCVVVRVYQSSRRRRIMGAICVFIFCIATNFAVQVGIDEGVNTEVPELDRRTASRRNPAVIDEPSEKLFSQVIAGDKEFTLTDSLVRLIEERELKYAVSNQDEFPEKTYYALEFLVFPEDLTDAEKKKLLSCPDAIENTELLIGKRPDAVITLFFNRYATHCSGRDSLLKTELKLRRSGFGITGAADNPYLKVSYSGISGNPAWDLKVACSRLESGGLVSLSISGESPVSADFDEKLKWNFKLNEEIFGFKPLGTFFYRKHAEAIALWDKKSAELKVAFFPEPLEIYDVFNIREQLGFHGLTRVKPDVVATFKISRNIRRVMREHVSRGYRLDFFPSVSTFNLPGESEKYTMEFAPGEQPLSLTGILRENERLIGRLQGSQVFPITEGIFELRWRIGFNARLVVS